MKAALIFLFFLGLLPFSPAAEFLEIEPRRFHLRSGTNAEWQEFASSSPHGKRLEVTFVARANPETQTLFLWQDDVRQDWRVELNGRRLGSLFLMESPLFQALPVPADALRDGTNTLAIVGPQENDDIRLGALRLANQPWELLADAMAEVRVRDFETGQPLPCRITFSDADHSLVPLHVATNASIAVRPGVVYASDGQARISLLPGAYTIRATRGFEFGLAATNVTLRSGERRSVELMLRREVATPGLVSSDTHVHTFTYSKHGDATARERAITLAGEGIELPIITDHDIAVDLGPAAREAGVESWFTPVVGDEVTTRVGHFNIFPIAPGAALPSNRATNWNTLLNSFRATPGVQVVILNHPRNVHTGFQPFARTNFNRVTGEARWPFDFSFDAMELINSSAQQSDYMTVFEDWFALLNAGHRIVGVGSSDGHDVSRYIVGQGRTYIECNDTNVARVDLDEACRNLKAGRAMVSMGLLPVMTVNDSFGSGSLVTKPGQILKVNVRVLSPPWIHPDRVELFANGIKIRNATLSSRRGREAGVAAEVQWEIPRPLNDVHLVAIATGPGKTAPHWGIARPYQPSSPLWTARVIGATNPIWIDADSDGAFASARGYAEKLLQQSGGKALSFVASLRKYDEAVAIQAAAAARRSGLNLRSREFQQALTGTDLLLERAFTRVIEEDAVVR